MAERVKVGVVGCGKISPAYLGMAKNFDVVEIVACADLDRTVAEQRAAEFGVPRVLGVDELIADPEVEVVLNLTVPKAHAPLAKAALEAGKHTYAEKPYGVNLAEGRAVLDLAAAKGLRTACAPDTFLGAGIQTARQVIDSGQIGRPLAFTAFNMGRGHESWHPSPEFYYEVGGGPMFDMGPYYLTALLNLLGPVRRLTGLASIAIPVRTITSEPKRGKQVTVETPDHVIGGLEFANGCTGSIITTFATMHPVYDGRQPITIYGEEGTLRVPDPNGFDGPVSLRRAGQDEWQEVPHNFVTGYGRSVGLADLAYALRSGRPHRCNGEQACGVLELMQGFLEASTSGQAVLPQIAYQRPAPMPAELPFGTLDE
ncbi:MAG: Gfo/Idh/MocA family oxidoreductase [Fimbriimonadaceae bacterium]|nr:Gfo/Idh/MocA family oxidoreductase [Fimbriimonadaceae bacterium]